MNWSRGFKRIWYVLLGMVWIGTLANEWGSASLIGRDIAYLLLFTLGWLIVGAVILWIARGFKRA